jgi:HD-like signal output (HDOD) protein
MTTGTTTSQPLTERIRKLAEQGKISLPPLPDLMIRLADVLKDESHASSKRIADLIRNEPAVAATVLRWANSAAFGGLHPISSLPPAIARLGFRQITSIVMTLSHNGHFKSESPDKMKSLETLWGHAVTTALAARHLAGPTSGEPEESFMAGLLHDVGKLLVLKGVDHLETRKPDEQITDVVMDELMDVLHTELGYKALVSWHLPESICDVAMRHHEEDIDRSQTLILRVQVADAIARKIGEHPKPDPNLDLLDLPAAEQLGITDIELATLLVDLEDEIAEVKHLL